MLLLRYSKPYGSYSSAFRKQLCKAARFYSAFQEFKIRVFVTKRYLGTHEYQPIYLLEVGKQILKFNG